MNTKSLSWCLVLLLSVAAACKGKTADKPKAADAAVAGATATPAGPLDERLAMEARTRPQIAINADKVLAALDAAGLATADPKQVLGATVNAMYCRNARIPAYTIIVVVCEYDSPADAAKGLEKNRADFKGLPGREVFQNGPTTLTVVLKRSGLPSNDEWGKKVIETYQALK